VDCDDGWAHSARYSHFVAILDCGVCSDEIQVEGDVSNGDELTCPTCDSVVCVYNR
jgi:hypothetical protein